MTAHFFIFQLTSSNASLLFGSIQGALAAVYSPWLLGFDSNHVGLSAQQPQSVDTLHSSVSRHTVALWLITTSTVAI